MSLLGIDVGTTGCKSIAFSESGEVLGTHYREYDIQRPHAGWSQLDAQEVWDKVKETIKSAAAAAAAKNDPIKALAVCSLGEAMVPVSKDRKILGPSLQNADVRGAEFLEVLGKGRSDLELHQINGNGLGNHYGLTKLLWVKKHEPELYNKTYKFLLWGSFVSFMLGAEPIVDYSLANRTLLFDLESKEWSDDLLNWSGLDKDKLPALAPSGTLVGTVAPAMAKELGLLEGVAIVTGAHDQCSNAVGCGVTESGQAMLGMGTYSCIVPVFSQRPDSKTLLERGLNAEDHAAPGRYVTFIYNQGGSVLKWYRDTFARSEHAAAEQAGRDIYSELLAEMPEKPGNILVLPHFEPTGPPDFLAETRAAIVGMNFETKRGDIAKGVLEGVIYFLRQTVDRLPEMGIDIANYRAAGGGSKSDAWLQICADILGRPFERAKQAEAGGFGAAIMAGTAIGSFASMKEAAEAMVEVTAVFEPKPENVKQYNERFPLYQRLSSQVQEVARDLSRL